MVGTPSKSLEINPSTHGSPVKLTRDVLIHTFLVWFLEETFFLGCLIFEHTRVDFQPFVLSLTVGYLRIGASPGEVSIVRLPGIALRPDSWEAVAS